VHGLTERVVRDALDSPHWLVVEEACFLAGELGELGLVPRLVELALGHEEPLVREAALGALGALGDDRAIPAVLAALASSNVYLRRRAVVVATAFEDSRLDAALLRAREDRDPQVRAILADLDAGAGGPSVD
jgi:HEAT repeat protein